MFFLTKKSRKKLFFYILDKKECFLDNKEQFQKTLTNRHFAKGLVQAFGEKIDLLLISFFFEQKSKKETFFLYSG